MLVIFCMLLSAGDGNLPPNLNLITSFMFDHIKQFLSSFSVLHQPDEYVSHTVTKFTCESVTNKAFDLDVSKHLEYFIRTLDYTPSQNLRSYWEDILTTVVKEGYFQMPKPTESHAWFIHE